MRGGSGGFVEFGVRPVSRSFPENLRSFSKEVSASLDISRLLERDAQRAEAWRLVRPAGSAENRLAPATNGRHVFFVATTQGPEKET